MCNYVLALYFKSRRSLRFVCNFFPFCFRWYLRAANFTIRSL